MVYKVISLLGWFVLGMASPSILVVAGLHSWSLFLSGFLGMSAVSLAQHIGHFYGYRKGLTDIHITVLSPNKRS